MSITRTAAALTGTALLAATFTSLNPAEMINETLNQAAPYSQVQNIQTDHPGSNPIIKHNGTPVTAASCTVTINMPTDAPEGTNNLMAQAANIITQNTPFTVTVATGTGNVPVTIINDSGNHTVAQAKYELSNAKISPKLIRINTAYESNLNDTERLHTYLHEIAHLLGLTHSDHPTSLMYSKVNSTTTLTDYELSALNQTGKYC